MGPERLVFNKHVSVCTRTDTVCLTRLGLEWLILDEVSMGWFWYVLFPAVQDARIAGALRLKPCLPLGLLDAGLIRDLRVELGQQVLHELLTRPRLRVGAASWLIPTRWGVLRAALDGVDRL